MRFLKLVLLIVPTSTASTWNRCPSGAIFSNRDCPDLLNTPPGITLAQCEAKCSSNPRCTAFNLGGGGCALRACVNGTEPSEKLGSFVGWASYPLKCPPVPGPAPGPPPPPPPPPIKYGFRFATTHTDKMVLQASPQHSIVWGFADNSSTSVHVCIGTDTKKCVDATLEAGPANSGAKIFSATLPIMPPSATAYDVSATAAPSGKTITLKDVVWGDVYICSGQSNMDFAVPMGFNASAEGSEADKYPDIRLFTVQKCRGGSPHNCVRRGPGPALEFLNASFSGQRWVPASRDSVYGSVPWTAKDYGGWEAHIGQVAGGRGFSAACWFFGRELYKRRRYPIGLVWSSIGGTPDEVWMPPSAFTACQSRPRGGDGWDLMISPLLRSVVAGVVWYQGESNEARPLDYNCTFPAMIEAWRQEWFNATSGNTARRFPFGFVQLSVHGGLPTYGKKFGYNMATWSPGYAAIRWAQTASVGVVPNPAMVNVFMATAVDIGEDRTPAGGPHVRDKQDVGTRLALAFRDNFVDGDGPFYTPGAVAVSAREMTDGGGDGGGDDNNGAGTVVSVTFNNLPPDSPPLRPPSSPLGLEVSVGLKNDSTAPWLNATSVALGADGKSVLVGSSVRGVRQVRYLWADNACLGWNSSTGARETGAYRCPLYTSRGLPVLPFVIEVGQ